MNTELTQELFAFIENSPTSCHTVQSAETIFKAQGFTELYEQQIWNLQPGGSYYVKRNLTSIIAFRYPGKEFGAYLIAGPHGDSPCFKIKEQPEIRVDGKYTKLNVEVYGGMALQLWADRPLSAAGKVILRTETGVRVALIDFKRDLFVIPSLAIHMNHEINNGKKMNAQIDMLPLFGGEKADFKQMVADELGTAKEDILSYDMYVYSRQKGFFFGEKNEFFAIPRIDDQQCVFSAVKAISASRNSKNVIVCAIFDNEEIGSMTKQGADSTFLAEILKRISTAAGKKEEAHNIALAGSFMLSADNAHGLHPNYPEKSDLTNKCYLNGGVVVKYSTAYATDALSAGVFRKICEGAGVPVQCYFNRSDVRGGSTLGNISNSHVSVNTVDIGLAQLAMHSPCETAGTEDTHYMIEAMKAFYGSVLALDKKNEYTVGKAKPADDLWQDISSNS